MTLNDVYKECEKKNIDIYAFKMQSKMKAISLPKGVIGLDFDKINTSIEEKEILMHEYSHIQTGSFYMFDTPDLIKNKCERRALTYTIKKLVPKDELIKCIAKGMTEYWELAEYFDISCKLMIEAINYYNELKGA